jgi:hypothetical protein
MKSTNIKYTSAYNIRIKDNAVGTATAYGLDNQGVGVRVQVEARIFSPQRQTGSGAYPAYYPTVTRGSIPGGNAAGA